MEFRHIKYFLTLAEELHFRRAADRLFIAQPALTRQIKELEASLGVLLFNRNKRHVSLTHAGKFLQQEGHQLIKRMEFIESSIAETGITTSGTVHIGYIGSAMAHLVPRLTHTLSKDLPQVKVNLVEDTTEKLVNLLMDGQLDIIFSRPHRKIATVRSETLFTDTTVVATARNSQWSIQDTSPVSDLKDIPFILYPQQAGAQFRERLVTICSTHGFLPKINYESIHAYSILRLVEQDLGISIIPESIAQGYNLQVDYRHIPDLTIPLELVVSYRIDHNTELLTEVLKQVRQLAD